MTIEQKRAALSKLYGPSWVRRVDQMKDAQVAAVYQTKLDKGELNG